MSIRADVDRGLEIREQLEKLSTELKDIQVRLAHAALHGEQIELTDADREGRQYLARGTTAIVPVILTADKLMGEFAANSPKHELVKLAARGKLLDFYKPANKFVNRFDNGKKFAPRPPSCWPCTRPASSPPALRATRTASPRATSRSCGTSTRRRNLGRSK